MNQLTSGGIRGSFKTLLTLLLMVLISRFADASVGSPKSLAQSSGALTYSDVVVHTFTGTPDAAVPNAGLVADSSGNLYGTTILGGATGEGAVFELTPDGEGGWKYKEIYSAFGGVGIAIDSQGNLYVSIDIAPGAVIELSPELGPGGPTGTWLLTRSYVFTGGPDGAFPGPVIVDANGNVYGSSGVVFELIPVSGQWQEQTIGEEGSSALIMDRAGNLYGTAEFGGTGNCGVVFKLHRTANGWKQTVLYNFQGGPEDGAEPFGNLVFDREGNLYGTASTGLGTEVGQNGPGGVYELTRSGQISWLYRFTGGADGGTPLAGLAIDQAGNLYGTTNKGGDETSYYCSNGVGGCGVVYELTPNNNGTGTWTESVLFSFTGGSDGDNTVNYSVAMATPLLDQAGNIYVTSPNGGNAYGAAGDGTVLELKPNPVSTTVAITSNFPSPSATGKTVTVSFAVSQSVTINTKPTGTVTVSASTGEACSAALPASGKAHCQLMFLSAGTRTLTATYSGDANDQGSVSTGVSQSVVNPTTTAITSNRPDPAKVGQTVVVRFSVEANGAAKHTKPTGNTTVNASTGESCTVALSASGNGSCDLTFSTAGSRTLTATYTGDDDNEGSISTAITETVK
jgi:uncharacterized repeat protein (TIGR03803 family)